MVRAILATAALVTALLPATAAQPPARWREAPEYLAQFAPPGPRAAAYRILVSPDTLDSALAGLNIEPAGAPGSTWSPRAVAPLDAFGQAGPYDRSRVARLYGSTRARVARGTTIVDGVREYWTLISPHPDAGLRRLEAGTLLLVLRYDRANPGR